MSNLIHNTKHKAMKNLALVLVLLVVAASGCDDPSAEIQPEFVGSSTTLEISSDENVDDTEEASASNGTSSDSGSDGSSSTPLDRKSYEGEKNQE